MLSKRPIIQACVLVFKVSDRTKPVQNFALDRRMSKDDINKDAFICRLRFKEGLNTKSSELGLGSTDVVVGYSQKSPNGPLCNFVESITEGLNGVNRQPSNGPKLNRQPSKTEYFYRQPSNERAKISRQISQISLNDRDRLT